MTEQNDPLAPLRGRGHIVVGMGERLPAGGRWIGGLRGEIGPVFADVAGGLEELNAVAHALNRALEADALLAARDAEIERLEALVADLDETCARLSASGGEGGEQ